MINIGRRLKYFRTRYGISQAELELSIELANGSVSRFESEKVIPSKDTILKISKFLDLTIKEQDYLLGPLGLPLRSEEVQSAKNEIEGYFNKKGVIAYLIDDRWRVWFLSKTFQKILKLSDEEVRNSFGKALLTVIFDESIGIINLLQKEKWRDIIYFQLARYYREIYFMQDDPVIKEVQDAINKIPKVREIWDEVLKTKGRHDPSYESRRVYFTLKGVSVELDYSREVLQKNRRFEIIEYVPSNKLVRLYTNLFL